MADSSADLTPEERRLALMAFRRAVAISGSAVKFGALFGITGQAVSKLIRNGRLLPGRHVETAFAATGVPRHELRPDLYPPEPAKEPPPVSAGPIRTRARPSSGAGAPVPRASHPAGISDAAGGGTCDRSAISHREALA